MSLFLGPVSYVSCVLAGLQQVGLACLLAAVVATVAALLLSRNSRKKPRYARYFVSDNLCCAFRGQTSTRRYPASVSQYRSSPLPPLANGIPFIGDTFQLLRLGPYVGIPHHKKHGKIYRGYLLGEQVIHVGDADACRKILTSDHKLVEADWPFTIAMLFGYKTVAMVTGQRHLEIRKMFLPAFSPKTNEQYIPRMQQIAEELTAQWGEVAQIKGEHAMKAFTGKVVTELILGFSTSFASPNMLAKQQALFDVLHQGLVALPINLPFTAYGKALQAKKKVHAMYRENIKRLTEDLDRPVEGRTVTCMELVIRGAKEANDSFYDMQFLEETCFHFVFSGHDSSASALTMLLHYLKKEPWVLEKLRQEQKELQEKHGSNMTADYLADMRYADVTIKECLRLAAIISTVPKRALTTFELGGFTIPKGCKVQVELWKILHDDPRWLSAQGTLAPTQFNPDRWLSEDLHKLSSFLAFSAGPRACPGQGFAYYEMKVLLAVLAREYDWELDLKEPLKTFPLPIPAWGVPMTFHKLNKTAQVSKISTMAEE